jgi:3',5'-cyclic AMP phosphodiesterase CpdA
VDAFFKDGTSRYHPFYGKRIYSRAELRQQDRTIWFVREAQAQDPLREIELFGARSTAPADFPRDLITTGSRMLLWVSDVHFSDAGHHAFPLAATVGSRMLGRALEQDLKLRNVDSLAGVIVSGDLTWEAAPSEFGHAKTFLRDIQSWARLNEPASFVVCPGNHDLRFSANPSSKDEPVTEASDVARAAYEAFYHEFFHLVPNQFLAMGRRFVVGNARVVDVAAVNSSLLQQHKDLFQGQGWVGDEQLEHVAEQLGWVEQGVEDPPFRILVIHHHLMPVVYHEVPAIGRQYSTTLDAVAVLRWAVRHRVRLVLHGHMHEPYTASLSLPLRTAGVLDEEHSIGVVALGSTGVSATHLGPIGRNVYALMEFGAAGVTVKMYPINSMTPANPDDDPLLSRLFRYDE